MGTWRLADSSMAFAVGPDACRRRAQSAAPDLALEDLRQPAAKPFAAGDHRAVLCRMDSPGRIRCRMDALRVSDDVVPRVLARSGNARRAGARAALARIFSNGFRRCARGNRACEFTSRLRGVLRVADGARDRHHARAAHDHAARTARVGDRGGSGRADRRASPSSIL